MNRSISNLSPNSTTKSHEETAGDEVVDLASLFNTLWRGKWLITTVCIASVLVGVYYAYAVARPEFTASSVVILDTNQEQVVDLGSIFPGMSSDDTAINSEVEVMRSRVLIGRVVDQLDLTSNPEFNSALLTPSLVSRLKLRVIDMLSGPDLASELTEEETAERARDRAINTVLNKIVIRNLPSTLVFEVRATTFSPTMSAALPEAIVQTYINDQLQVKLDQMDEATNWLSERVAELQTQLEEAEVRVNAFNASTDLVNPEMLLASERQLKEVRTRIEDAKTTVAALTERQEQEASATTYAEKAELFNDAQLRGFLPRIDEPAIAQAFDTRYAQLVTRDQSELLRAQNQLAVLQNSEKSLSQQIETQNADLIQLQQLTREAEATRLLYEHFLTRLKETSAQQGIQSADSRLLSHAVQPLMPSAPRKSVIVAMAAILGFMLSSAIVLIREIRQNTFRMAQDLERKTGYTVMGQIPLLPARARRDVLQYLVDKPASSGAEAVRNLRTSVLLSNVANPPQIIGTSSSVPGEGKTTMSLSLAQNFTGMGKKVLIIEGDIRRRVFGQYLNSTQQEGLITVLNGKKTLEEVILTDDRVGHGTDILIGENSSVNAADLFSSAAFSKLIAEVREKYDTIIIDTPPVLVVPDARIVAQHVDAMLFVVAWDRTPKSQVTAALHMFEASGQKISGLVLNQINPKGMRNYGYGGKYGGYGAYGSYGGKYYEN